LRLEENVDNQEIKRFLIELIDEEFGPKPIEISPKWRGGSLVMKPGNDAQSKEIPVEVFFKKILTVRDSLRVLEQKLNGSPLSGEEKATFQGYITKAYGALTTFNIFFKDGKDKFVGSGSGGGNNSSKSKMTISEAKSKIGLNEY